MIKMSLFSIKPTVLWYVVEYQLVADHSGYVRRVAVSRGRQSKMASYLTLLGVPSWTVFSSSVEWLFLCSMHTCTRALV
jgi:hypothetical protein